MNQLAWVVGMSCVHSWEQTEAVEKEQGRLFALGFYLIVR